jgi:hypothetical protein
MFRKALPVIALASLPVGAPAFAQPALAPAAVSDDSTPGRTLEQNRRVLVGYSILARPPATAAAAGPDAPARERTKVTPADGSAASSWQAVRTPLRGGN